MTQMVLNISDVSLVPSLKQILEAIKGITIDSLISNVDKIIGLTQRFFKFFEEENKKMCIFAGRNHLGWLETETVY